ncbi:peptidoglycan editing factor PgeF [Rheinheimera riviphila]|uniref:Purine nucleoside phosphorylase n=1 Tax=Rheinheimera riviphila TaxID=1834037 RepID=A0A437QS91_9GAMM|nr:peptidoglycan editing factor PgeF [Rheinheimera riviphila]RVU37383.1 peptidoglycan editing factor PgeF [Rheinheimera riviphila]
MSAPARLTPLWLTPDWPAPASVKALSTTRQGGVSTGVYASLNLGSHVGDAIAAVEQNRALLQQQAALPQAPAWLNQVHGTAVLDLANWQGELVSADAAVSQQADKVCLVMTADCLPVLFCNLQGTQVAAAHAGWRGLCDGVLEQTLAHFAKPDEVMVWFGPAIGPGQFEVGSEVRTAFMQKNAGANLAFVPQGDGKYLANIYLLARQRLLAAGVTRFYGGEHCTVSESELFFSYRRDGQTGRMASCIWLG